MLGSLISGIIKVATLPIDAVEAVADVVIEDGDGSKRSRQRHGVSFVSDVRDGVAKAAKEIDE